MKKLNFFASVLLVSVLSITSCTHDDVVNEQTNQQTNQQEVVPQKISTNLTSKSYVQSLSYNTGNAAYLKFTSVPVTGKSLLQISASNTGSAQADLKITTTNGDLIADTSLPVGYFGTKNFYFSGYSGTVVILVSTSLANVNINGFVTIATN
jgi:hypothetical protein